MKALLLVALLAAIASALKFSPTYTKLLRGDYTLELESEQDGQPVIFRVPMKLDFGQVTLRDCLRDIGHYSSDVDGGISFDEVWVSSQDGCTRDEINGYMTTIRGQLKRVVRYGQAEEGVIVLMDKDRYKVATIKG